MLPIDGAFCNWIFRKLNKDADHRIIWSSVKLKTKHSPVFKKHCLLADSQGKEVFHGVLEGKKGLRVRKAWGKVSKGHWDRSCTWHADMGFTMSGDKPSSEDFVKGSHSLRRI